MFTQRLIPVHQVYYTRSSDVRSGFVGRPIWFCRIMVYYYQAASEANRERLDLLRDQIVLVRNVNSNCHKDLTQVLHVPVSFLGMIFMTCNDQTRMISCTLCFASNQDGKDKQFLLQKLNQLTGDNGMWTGM